ncbi:PLD nuclease N-terminal domain-containing protein [Sinomonas mesophila]|uniref:PLD nuclease N-terminal domain-containing protein n=1 Tax=Sinomonas mesophila TaxID=1531955 RepID=UPI000985ADF8|nr:PLD nuclease N-terminal domain-containing protein [Sinomonas mesophila]
MGRRKKKWSELSGGQRFGVVLGAAIQMTLQGLALRDLAKRPSDQVNGPKAAWALGTLINGIGPIAYFLLGRKHVPAEIRRGSGTKASTAGLHTAVGVGLGKKL